MAYRTYIVAVALALGIGVIVAVLFWLFPGGPFVRTALDMPPLFVAGAPVLPATTQVTTSSAPLPPPRTPPAGELEYRSSDYRFSLFYPDTLATSSYDEGGGAQTLVFQDPQAAAGFQIFVVPYTATQVDQARFEEDEPSGVRGDLTNIVVDGATAASFYGNTLLGDTREVWVIHGGYLYEITAPKAEDASVTQLISTWKFL